jgi:16S rRNA (guanine966-N2)-methyltransferase
MKIVAGKYKGKRLEFVSNKNVRPMMEKVRAAIYDVLQDSVVDKTMIDLFCGSGSVGIEGLSRGIKSVDFVDLNIFIVKKNIQNLELSDNVNIYKKDVEIALNIINKKQKTYDIVFIGAPYKYTKVPEILQKIDDFDILNKSGTLIVEHQKGLDTETTYNNIKHKKIYKYGQTFISFYTKQN